MNVANIAVSQPEYWGMSRGDAVDAIELSNGLGWRLNLLTLGATIQSLQVPDRDGALGDVVLGFDTLDGYLGDSNYFGVTVGRVANRIAGARFRMDGRIYPLSANEGRNTLHGGAQGFDRRVWRIEQRDNRSATLGLVSEDCDQGFPGRLTVTARFELLEDALMIEYRAETDFPTVVNLSNHCYWNLGGDDAADGVMNHRLTIPAEHFLPVDAQLIPTGALWPVAGTAFDFRSPRAIGKRIRDAGETQLRHGRGYDHCWAIGRDVAEEMRLLARVDDAASGRALELWSDQPGLQFFSGNGFDGGIVGKGGRCYRQGDGLVLEAQRFPDAPNQPQLGSVRLDPGEVYLNRIAYRFLTTG